VQFFMRALRHCLSAPVLAQFDAAFTKIYQKFTSENSATIPTMEWLQKRGDDLVTMFEKKSGSVLA